MDVGRNHLKSRQSLQEGRISQLWEGIEAAGQSASERVIRKASMTSQWPVGCLPRSGPQALFVPRLHDLRIQWPSKSTHMPFH